MAAQAALPLPGAGCLSSHPPGRGDRHDQPYAQGGTAQQRFDADSHLLLCVAKIGHPWWAMLLFVAVRLGGVPWLPTPWRFGFNQSFWSHPTSLWYKKEEETSNDH